MGRDYTEEEKAFLSQVTASGSGLQRTTTTLSVQDRQVDNSSNDYLIFDPTGTVYSFLLSIYHRSTVCTMYQDMRFVRNVLNLTIAICRHSNIRMIMILRISII